MLKKALFACCCVLALAGAFAAVEAGLFFLTTTKVTTATLTDFDNTVKHFDTAFAPVLDCVQVDPKTGQKHSNPACLPSQLLATVGSFKAMAGAGAKAAPVVVKDFETIAGSMTKSSDNVAKLTSNLSNAAAGTNTQITRIGDTVVALKESLDPALSSVSGLTSDARSDLAALQPALQKSLGNLSDASGNISTASQNFSNLIPVIQKQIVNIGGSVQQTTDHIAELTKPHWYDRVIGYSFTALSMYRSLYPAVPNINIGSTIQKSTQK